MVSVVMQKIGIDLVHALNQRVPEFSCFHEETTEVYASKINVVEQLL